MTAATLSGENSSLASQCLALCQKLVSQGKAFTFSLKIDSNSTLSFSLEPKESKASSLSPEALTRKKVSPSTKRRNARRRAEFLKKKQSTSIVQQVDVASSVSISVTTLEQAATSKKPNSSPPRETNRQPPFEFKNFQVVSWALTHFASILTCVPMIVVLTTTTGSTIATMLCGLFETEILATKYSTALAPAQLLLDVPVVGCGYLKSLCQLENPIRLIDK